MARTKKAGRISEKKAKQSKACADQREREELTRWHQIKLRAWQRVRERQEQEQADVAEANHDLTPAIRESIVREIGALGPEARASDVWYTRPNDRGSIMISVSSILLSLANPTMTRSDDLLRIISRMEYEYLSYMDTNITQDGHRAVVALQRDLERIVRVCL